MENSGSKIYEIGKKQCNGLGIIGISGNRSG